MEFSPIDRTQSDSAIVEMYVTSMTTCVNQCMVRLPVCRMFEYDQIARICRLFEDDTTTGRFIVSTSSSNVRLGMIELKAEYFSMYGQPCSNCYTNRFFRCVNNTCQCSSNSYFDGYICKLKRFTGGSCSSKNECRVDYNLTCLRFLQCGHESIYYGETVAGYGDSTSGNNATGLNTPAGIYVSANEDLYVTDVGNSRIQVYASGSKIGKTVAGNGVNGSSSTQLNMPITIYVDPLNNDVYVADNLNYRIQLWPANATFGRTVAGGSPSIIGRPAGVRLDKFGSLYLSESAPTSRVLRWPRNATNETNATLVAGSTVSGPSAQLLNSPRHLDIDANNEYLYIADNRNHRIQRWTIMNISNAGETVAGGNGAGAGANQLNSPRSVCVSKRTGTIYVADTNNNRVQRWTMGATQGYTIGGSPDGTAGATDDKLSWPAGIALNNEETYLYVADQNNNRVLRFRLI